MLIRHGKAEEPSNDKKDFERTLTEEGKKELAEFAPTVQAYLADETSIHFWTSPLVRAKQTSKILTDVLNIEKVEEKEFIPTGDFDQLLEALNSVDDGGTVICVGHKPHLGDWAEKLIGTPFSFPKGGVRAFQIDLNEEDKNILVWKSSTDSTENDENAEEVRDILFDQVETMENAYLNFSNNPYEPKTTHKLRVSMRTMRALLNFVKPVIGKTIYKNINNELKEAANLLGPLREIDVLIKECTKVAYDEPKLIDNYADVFKELYTKRRRILQSATSKTTDKQIKQAVEFTREQTKSLPLYLENTNKEDWESYLTKRLKKKKKKVKKGYEKLDISDFDAAHELRKDAKKLRYSADSFGYLTSKNSQKISGKAEDIQDELGDMRDHHVNSEFLKELAKETDKEDIQSSLKKLSQYEEDKSIQLVNEKLK